MKRLFLFWVYVSICITGFTQSCNIIPSVDQYETSMNFGSVIDTRMTICYTHDELCSVAKLLQGYIYSQTGMNLKVRSKIHKAEAGDYPDHAITLTISNDTTLYLNQDQTYGVNPKGGIPVDESYHIRFYAGKIVVSAKNAEGVFRGISSLRQLIGIDKDRHELKSLTIKDKPAFAWRGLSLDVARNFYTVEEVKSVIEIMSLYKMNVLHLHLTDNEGWRIEIKQYPDLALKGGFIENQGRTGGYYTQQQFKELVSYAAERFITIVPEIDFPGHTNALLRTYPHLPNASKMPFELNIPGQACASLDPDDLETMKMVEAIIREVAELTPGVHLHVGGDETFGMDDEKYIRFVKKIRQMVKATEKMLVGWQEMARAEVGEGDILQNWISFSKKQMKQARDSTRSVSHYPQEVVQMLASSYRKAPTDIPKGIKKGAKVLLSPSSFAYMDCPYEEKSIDPKQAKWKQECGQMNYARQNLEDVFNWNPTKFLRICDWTKDIAGVEGAIWSETISDIHMLQFLLLPRLAGVAEKGWSGDHDGCWSDYRERLAHQAAIWDVNGWTYFKSELVNWK